MLLILEIPARYGRELLCIIVRQSSKQVYLTTLIYSHSVMLMVQTDCLLVISHTPVEQ